jgi:hypothetical protein
MRNRQLLPTFALIRRSSGSFNTAVNSRTEPNSKNCPASVAEFSVLDFDRFLFKPLTQHHRPGAHEGAFCVPGGSLLLP